MKILRLAILLLIGVVLFAGGKMVPLLGRGEFIYSGHFRTIAWQLEGIREELRGFRARHGRYPTAEEGLGVLDGFVGTVKTVREPAVLYGDLFGRPRPAVMSRFPAYDRDIEAELCLHHQGYDPTARFDTAPPSGPGPDIVVTSSARIFLRSGGCLYSPWLIPYVYENRSGWSPEAIRGSPAGDVEETPYSIRVDEGIFVVSAGALELRREKLRKDRKELAIALAPFGIAAFLGGILWLATRRRPPRPATRWWAMSWVFAVASWVLGLLAGSAFRTTCYVVSFFASGRRPAMAARYRELLDGYREAGVLAPETHGRLLEALDKEYEALRGRR